MIGHFQDEVEQLKEGTRLLETVALFGRAVLLVFEVTRIDQPAIEIPRGIQPLMPLGSYY